MPSIKLLNNLSPAGLQTFTSEYQLTENATQPEALLVRSADLHSYDFNEELLCIARAGAGTNNIPLEACAQKGIVVFNTPGANANAVKELLIAALLLSSRKIAAGISWVQKQSGEDLPAKVEAGKKAFTGPELQGKTLGVIGLGAIGVMVANVALNLGMKVWGYDPYISVDAAWGLSQNVKRATDLEQLYRKSDYVTLHIPMTAGNTDYIDAAALAQMKPGVRIVNLSRGELVNTEALLAALAGKQVAAYVTDFPMEALQGVEGVIAIPHLGASTPDSEDNCAVMAAAQIMAFLEDGNIGKSVNFPTCEMPRASQYRLTCIHENKPNMLGQISSLLAGEEVNIANLMNKSRGEYAYTMIDTEVAIETETLAKIEGIGGMIKVRMLG